MVYRLLSLDNHSQTLLPVATEGQGATQVEISSTRVLPDANPKGRWDADGDRQRFVMRDERGVATACADYAFLGTYSTASGTWLWAWANGSIPPDEREVASRVKEIGVKEGLSQLTQGRLPCSDREALEIAAVALDVLDAEAFYRFAMTPTSTAYLALFSVRKGAEAAKLEPTRH